MEVVLAEPALEDTRHCHLELESESLLLSGSDGDDLGHHNPAALLLDDTTTPFLEQQPRALTPGSTRDNPSDNDVIRGWETIGLRESRDNLLGIPELAQCCEADGGEIQGRTVRVLDARTSMSLPLSNSFANVTAHRSPESPLGDRRRDPEQSPVKDCSVSNSGSIHRCRRSRQGDRQLARDGVVFSIEGSNSRVNSTLPESADDTQRHVHCESSGAREKVSGVNGHCLAEHETRVPGEGSQVAGELPSPHLCSDVHALHASRESTPSGADNPERCVADTGLCRTLDPGTGGDTLPSNAVDNAVCCGAASRHRAAASGVENSGAVHRAVINMETSSDVAVANDDGASHHDRGIIHYKRWPSKAICSREEERCCDGKLPHRGACGRHEVGPSVHAALPGDPTLTHTHPLAVCNEGSPPTSCAHNYVDCDWGLRPQEASETGSPDLGPHTSPRMAESSFIVHPDRPDVHNPISAPSGWPGKCEDCAFCENNRGRTHPTEVHLDVMGLQSTSSGDSVKGRTVQCSPKRQVSNTMHLKEITSQPSGSVAVSAVASETPLDIPNPTRVVFDTLKQNLDTDREAKRKLRQQNSPGGACAARARGHQNETESPKRGDQKLTPGSSPTASVMGDDPDSPVKTASPTEVPVQSQPVDNDTTPLPLQQECEEVKLMAPPLGDSWLYHVFFLYHHGDHPWVLEVVRQLESPKLGFRCCCLWREMDHRASVLQMAAFGLQHSHKMVVVASPDFISEMWYCADPRILTERDISTRFRDLVVLDRFSCDLPRILTDLAYIDVRGSDWWNRLLKEITYRDETVNTVQGRNHISVTVGPSAGLESGYLLVSLKSRYNCCGKEVVDPTKVPSDLIGYGVQISQEDYSEAVSCLMRDPKFRCHVWCYNVPAAITFFTLLLGACLAVIPVVESELILHSKETGVEFVHGAIIWLCFLTAYLFIMHIAKKRMKSSTYAKLTQMNNVLVKYNLLAGVENLGLGDCNKYYLHIFYFELGPCMAYLQELLLGMDEAPCTMDMTTATNTTNTSSESSYQNAFCGNEAIEIDHVITGSDQSQALEATRMTNTTLQTGAEGLLLANSGEYLSQLITKKLAHPHTTRHVQDAVCLCQYVEHRIFKLPV